MRLATDQVASGEPGLSTGVRLACGKEAGVETTQSPYVSIVVPTYGRPSLLRDCIESLVEQTFDDSHYEIVVVADGPQREARRIVNEFTRDGSGPSLRYVEIGHRGPNAARNAGIAAATGSLLCFVDDDVEAPAAWLEQMVSGIGGRHRLVCFGGPIRSRFEAIGPRICGRTGCHIGAFEFDAGDLEREVDAVGGGNLAVPREAFELIGLFDESLPIYGDEVEWEHRLRLAGGTIVYLPEAWLWHRKAAEDLGLRRLLRLYLVYGNREAAHWVELGRPLLWIEALKRLLEVPRLLGHALRRKCWNGVLVGIEHVAFATGAVIHGSKPIGLAQADHTRRRGENGRVAA